MPFDTAFRSSRQARTLAVPAALAGSIALVMSAAPAQAFPAEAENARGLTLTAIPASVLHGAVRSVVAPPTYTVVAGDTVSTIAQRFGLRTADVLALNGLSWSSVIYPGQTLTLVGAAAPAPAPAPASTYAVRGGDTLIGIAQRHGVTLRALFDANGLDYSSVIYPGQTIAIPGGAAALAAAPAAAPAPAPAAPAASTTHTVSGGDTLSGIAQRYGITLKAVFDANGLGWSSIIYPGQTLAIPGAAGLAAAPAAAPAPAASVDGLDAEQVANARVIIQVGRELGVSDRGIAIALGAAMQESWIRNLDWGDRDSLGLFQQRPSTGWGTPAEILDPVRATKVFFGGASDPNGSRTRGLLDIPGWEGMSFAQAAQAVQISAFPDRYARWEQPAYAWLAALG
ncbi:LysM peptidoglycan-binding domain-containing protein [Microbacterium sp.]|uniref:LysM peptidoglycan-binding domain-containing protein n=1 Tax=Microbacterium sp. TaxID=51671 RepID=UPI003F719FBD